MQFAIDVTLVSPLHCDGAVRPGAAHIDGVARRSTPERTHFSGTCWPPVPGLALSFVLGGEVGGKWSEETSTFVRLQAKPRPIPNLPCCALGLELA